MKNFEICDLTINQILVNELNFDDVPELFKAYSDLYPTHEIAAFSREYEDIHTTNISRRNNFTNDWFDLVEENLCNFY